MRASPRACPDTRLPGGRVEASRRPVIGPCVGGAYTVAGAPGLTLPVSACTRCPKGKGV